MFLSIVDMRFLTHTPYVDTVNLCVKLYIYGDPIVDDLISPTNYC